MNIISLILIIVAIVLFVVEALRTRSLVAWGLAAFAAAAAAQWLIEASDKVTL